MIDGWGISNEVAIRWMSLDFTKDKSTLVQVMAWCRQQQAITWTSVDPDLCCHMASLGPNELTAPLWSNLCVAMNTCQMLIISSRADGELFPDNMVYWVVLVNRSWIIDTAFIHADRTPLTALTVQRDGGNTADNNSRCLFYLFIFKSCNYDLYPWCNCDIARKILYVCY